MSAPARPGSLSDDAQDSRWSRAKGVIGPLVLRWLLIAVLTVFAFHRSLTDLVNATRGGTLSGYAWTVLAASVLAAVAITRRERRELPIHDRQTDIIIGTMVLVLSLLLHGVLLRRYTIYFSLMRLDLVAMWLFVLGCAIVLFGLRPVQRYAAVWAMFVLLFPLPYHILVVALGNNRIAAGMATLLIPMWTAWICVGRTRRRGATGALLALLVGVVVLAVMAVVVPRAPLLAYQLVPSLSAIAVTGIVMYLYARRGDAKRLFDRDVAPLASPRVWAAVPLVVVVAVLLSFVRLPTASQPTEVEVDGAMFWKPLIIPTGWHQTAVREYPRVGQLYGDGAVFIRQTITANEGNPRWDKHSRPRTIWIDSITTRNPFQLGVYPAITLYPLPRSRPSPPRLVDIGSGVTAALVSTTDDGLLVTWNVLLWTWHTATAAQRIMMFAVDYHDDGAPVPEPGHAVPTVLNSLFSVLFRGNSAVLNRAAQFKDAEMLTEVGRKLVAAQLGSAGEPG